MARCEFLANIRRGDSIMIRTIFVLFALALTSFAQMERQPVNWEPFKYFVGSWEGMSKGEMGAGKTEREYKLIMNGTFLEVRNKASFAPREKDGKPIVHEDFGIVSYDDVRKNFILRQFHTEGFVNQYVLSGMSGDNKPSIWVTESIENNIEPGWRARERYKIVSKDEFVERFELAAPGKDFSPFNEITFKRKR
jgi:hypothetical protein